MLSGRLRFEKFEIIHTTLTFHDVFYNFDAFLGLVSLDAINFLSELRVEELLTAYVLICEKQEEKEVKKAFMITKKYDKIINFYASSTFP